MIAHTSFCVETSRSNIECNYFKQQSYFHIIPSLHPHFIDDEYPYHGGIRIESLQKKYGENINLVPHPFL
jgi:hypothetical protein